MSIPSEKTNRYIFVFAELVKLVSFSDAEPETDFEDNIMLPGESSTFSRLKNDSFSVDFIY